MKILAYIPPVQVKSPARIYRGEGMLERLGATVDYVTPEMLNWDWAQWMRAGKEYDWLFLMRPAQPHEVQFASRAQGFGIKLWYDLDDDYSAVEPDNAAWPTFQRQDVRDSWQWFLENADLVTYSTQGLVKKFGKGHWLPNALDDKIFDLKKSYPAPKKGLITWRGGGSHFQDLQDFAPMLNSVIANSPDWTFHFMGFYPYWMSHKNVKVTQYIQDYWYFMSMFEQMKPWGHVVPLNDNGFNRSKSCIAALEAIYAGAVPIVPNFEEWEIPGALVYNDAKSFMDALNTIKAMTEEEHQGRWTLAMNWLRENRSLSKVNEKRLEILLGASE